MCGLLGFVGTPECKLSPQLAAHVINHLMLANTARGGDSFGIAVVDPEKKTSKTYKVVGKLRDTLDNKGWRHGLVHMMDIMAAGRTVVVMGHNRAATCGANTTRNAHPFNLGTPGEDNWVLGAHNGMLRFWEDAKKEWDITRSMEVDSEIIFRGIQKHGQAQELNVLGSLEPLGTIATTYMTNLETIKMYRCDNPLYVADAPGHIFWASLDTHLENHAFGLYERIRSIPLNKLVTVGLHDTKIQQIQAIEGLVHDTLLNDLDTTKSIFSGRNYGSSQHSSWYNNRHASRSGGEVVDSEDPFVVAEKEISTKTKSLGGKDGGGRSISTTLGVRLSTGHSTDFKEVDINGVTNRVMPGDMKDQCLVCARTMKPWQMLWLDGECMDARCYYYISLWDEEERTGRTYHTNKPLEDVVEGYRGLTNA